MEHWRQVYKGYFISPQGKLWSSWSERFLEGYVGANGYLYYTFRDGYGDYAHRLVATHYIYNPLELPQINHKDFDRLNNSIDNLEWCTVASNNLHAHSNPNLKTISSYNHSNSKLTKEQALEIFNSDLSQRKLASVYGVSSRTIHDIKHGVKYGWATKEGNAHEMSNRR